MSNKLFLILIAAFVLYFIARYFYMKPKFRNGENIPVIEGELLNGAPFSLDDLKGKYVLIDFWGSWCGPCRKENPDLVRIYEKYHDKTFKNAKGFEIVSIGIETNEDAWKKAIQNDNLIWPYHLIQAERFQSPIVKAFGVREIPTKYLLNEKLQIISVNGSSAMIDKILSDRLSD